MSVRSQLTTPMRGSVFSFVIDNDDDLISLLTTHMRGSVEHIAILYFSVVWDDPNII